ncbi:Ankyrin repeat-containing domain protein [Lactarius tabidus]
MHGTVLGQRSPEVLRSDFQFVVHRSVLRLAPLLLEHGADINAQNKDQETPLHLASRLRLHDMARFLLKHGADVSVKNSEGKSLLQVATGRKGKAIRRLLSEYSAKQALCVVVLDLL